MSQSSWNLVQDLSLDGIIDLTDNMTISATTSDFVGFGHLVEAGFDAFLVTEGLPSSSNDLSIIEAFEISPNPFKDQLNINWTQNDSAKALFYNQQGKLIKTFTLKTGSNQLNFSSELPSGLYHIKTIDKAGQSNIEKVIKI